MNVIFALLIIILFMIFVSYKKIDTIYLLYYKREIDTDNPTIRATINELMNGT